MNGWLGAAREFDERDAPSVSERDSCYCCRPNDQTGLTKDYAEPSRNGLNQTKLTLVLNQTKLPRGSLRSTTSHPCDINGWLGSAREFNEHDAPRAVDAS